MVSAVIVTLQTKKIHHTDSCGDSDSDSCRGSDSYSSDVCDTEICGVSDSDTRGDSDIDRWGVGECYTCVIMRCSNRCGDSDSY